MLNKDTYILEQVCIIFESRGLDQGEWGYEIREIVCVEVMEGKEMRRR